MHIFSIDVILLYIKKIMYQKDENNHSLRRTIKNVDFGFYAQND